MESPRIRHAAAFLAVACALAGCTRFNIRSRQDPSFDFGGLRTYAWLPVSEAAPADQRTLNRILSARIQRAIESELRGKGYAPADGPPDFLLNYRLATQPASDVKGDPRRAFADAFWWGLPDSEGFYTESYDEGTLYVAILDAETRRIRWVGAAGARLMPTSSMENAEKRVDDAVHQIMERFPAR
jgi:hypothetical protein